MNSKLCEDLIADFRIKALMFLREGGDCMEFLRIERSIVNRLESLEKDAARWNKVLHHVGADNHLGGAHYVIRGISAPENVMRGAVSQHFEKSIDTAMQANKGGMI